MLKLLTILIAGFIGVAEMGANVQEPNVTSEFLISRKIVIVAIMMNANRFSEEEYLRHAFRSSIQGFDRRSKSAQSEQFKISYFFCYGLGANVQSENKTYHDIVQLKTEREDDGKSFELLELVSQRKGDYLVKIEGTTTVRWSRLRLVAQLEAPVYFGEMREHHLDGLKGPIQICTPVCTDLRLGSDATTFYMNGGFYGLSMDTVRKLVSCEYAQTHKSGREDILTAIWLKMCALPVISVSFPPGIIH